MDMTTLNLGGALALGQRIVISVDGTIKVLEEGQPLQAGDVVLESQNGSNEPQVSAKRFSSEEGEIELDQDIANIFAALEEGQDPTELGEEFATAAGQNGSSLASSGTIERDGEETIPGTEFVTTGFEALGMSRTQSLSLLDAFRSIEQSGSQGTDSETIGDTTAPAAPDLTLDTDSGSAADDFLTNDGSFTVGGTEDGATVEYFVDGNWTTTAAVPTEGDNTITVRQTDAAGNTSGSSTLTFTLDTTAPVAPALTLDTDSGSAADDFLTNDGSFTVGGTEDGATVEYFVDGTWTTTAPVPVEGGNTITVRQTDAAGNTSGSSTLTFSLDTTAPVAPALTLDTDSGSAADDFLTNDGSFTVGGTEDGATVEYFVDGNWTTTAPVPVEGDNTITVRQTDAAGNTSGSSTLTFTLDTQAESGNVSVDSITSDDVVTETEKEQTIFVTGTAIDGDIQPNDVVTAVINGTTYTSVVKENGTWELSVNGEDLAEDTEFTVSVSSTDSAGNSVSSSETSTHIYDSTPVNVNIDIDPITEDSVINATEAQGTVTITGSVTGENYVSGTVALTVNGVEYVGQVIDGKYSIDVNGSDLNSDSDNIVDAKVDVVNEAGNVGSATSTEFYLVDLTARGTIVIESIADDNVINQSESESTVSVKGTVGRDADTGDQVSVVVNGVTYLTVVQSDKTWSIDVQGSDLVADNSVTATVTGQDWVGNEFSSSISKAYDLDTDISKPTIDLVDGSDTGNSDTDNLTNDTTPTFALGNIDSDADKVEVFDGSTKLGDAVQAADGSWSFTPSTELADGTYDLSVKVTDDAGNEKSSDALEVIIDTTAGAGIDIDQVTGDGIVNAEEASSDQEITGKVSGDASQGDTVHIYLGTGDSKVLIGSTHVLADNTFKLVTHGSNLIMGNPADLTATVTGSDDAGNDFVASNTERYFVFTDIPEAPSITNISDDSAASDYSEVTLGGTGEPGSTILLFDEDNNQVNVGPITVDNDGNWTTDISNLVSTSVNDNEFFTAKQVDNYGNTSEASNTVHYYHGDASIAVQEATDDFVLLGEGDDQFNATENDIDNRLVVDGGAGTDTAVFDFSLDSASVTLNADGSVSITENNGDVNTFIEFENFNFTDGGKTVEELFAPSVVIVKDEDDIINSDRTVVLYNVSLPAGAEVGATLTVQVEGQLIETKVLTQADINSGSLSFDVDMDTVVDGELNVSAELTYQDQPAGAQFVGTDALSTNIDPSASSFSIELGTEQSVQFTFDSHVSDAEDDLSSTDNKDVQLSIIDLPEFGSLYVVDGDIRTLVNENTVLSEDSQIEYVLDETVNSDLSFDASEDFNNINGSKTSYTLDSGVIISGGRFDGDRPDSSSSLTAETLHYDSAANESGLGVGDKELDVSTKDYISIDFTQVGDSNATEVTVTEVNIDFGSVWAHYADNNSADAEIQVLLFKDGVQVGNDPYIFDDDTNSAVYDGSGEFTANIQLDGGFDEIRVYTVNGDQSNGSNSNITLQGVEVVDAIVSEKITYEATDSDKGTDTGVITISTSSTQDSTNKAPVLNDSQFDASNEDQVVSLSLDKLNVSDADGDQTFITGVTVDPSYGSIQLVTDSEGRVVSADFAPVSDKHFDNVPFTVTVSDGVKSSEGTATLVVNAVADEPNVTVVFGDASNVVISDALHTKLVNADANTSFTESDYAELGHTVMNQYGQKTGTVGNDLIVGSDVSSGDTLIGDANTNPGGTGSDIFVGRDGDDHISGGTGSLDAESAIDTAVYEGNFSEYNLTFVGDTTTQHDWTIIDNLNRDTPESGSTGDKLYQIERLIFADAIVELNEDGTFNVLQDVGFTVTASVADTDGSEYLDEVRISGLPDSAEIIDKDTGNVLGGFVTVGDESVWVINIEGDTTQHINYDNLAVRDSSGEQLDVDVEVVAVDVNENVSTANTSVNVAETNDVMADQGGSVPTTVISLIIDSSGSMASTPNGLSDMRIEYVLQASINLLENVKSQEGSEKVWVQLIDFDSEATNTGWKTVTEAIALLETAQEKVDEDNYNGIFDAEGWTYYEDGVGAAIDGYKVSPVSDLPAGETNDVVYFLSDGQNNGSWDSDTNSDWDSFIVDKDVTAVGVGSSGNVPVSGLTEVAGANGKVVYIPDSTITTELPKLRPTIGIAGSLLLSLSGLDAVAVMIDESKASVIQKVETDGNTINLPTGLTFTKDTVGNELVVDIGYGEFRIAQDGSYYFQPSSDSTAIETGKAAAFEILVTVEDSQGVQSQQLITLNLSPSGEVNVAPTSSFNASTGDDQFQGTEQDDIILGHAGNDVLLGAGGDDILLGGDGSDILIGGLGDDILTGGDGDDIFKWVDEPLNSYQDVITDFEVGSDRIDLSELLHDENTMDDVLEHLSAKISDNNQDLELTITNDQGSQTIVLQGQANNLSGFDVDSSGVYSGDELTNLVNSLMTNLPNS